MDVGNVEFVEVLEQVLDELDVALVGNELVFVVGADLGLELAEFFEYGREVFLVE